MSDESHAGVVLRRLRKQAGLSQGELAAAISVRQATISRYENGEIPLDERTADQLDRALHAGGELRRALRTVETPRVLTEVDALDLAGRATSGDVSTTTLDQLAAAFDDLATAYSTVPPAALLPAIAEHIGYVKGLLGGRLTLNGHHRLLGIGGWLSLLAATVHIDLNQHREAIAWLRACDSLAQHTGDAALRGWAYETEAWRTLNTGNLRRAVNLACTAVHHAPAGSSIEIQATAQHGRCLARLGVADGAYRAVERVNALCDQLPEHGKREHHYHYDTDKAAAYTATTLAWLGDADGEQHASAAVERFGPSGPHPWPRRRAAAYMDLALIASKTGALDAATAAALDAINTGAVAPSNYWRIGEVVTAIHDLPEGRDLATAYHELTSGTPAMRGHA